MGILKEMFDEGSGDDLGNNREEVLLAKGRYKSDPETILLGYKTYQKKYVVKSLVFKMLLVLLALASSIMMLITTDGTPTMPAMMILICVAIGAYFISEPINNRKKLKKGLEIADGTEYEAVITDRTLKISTVELPKTDETDDNAENEEKSAEENSENTASAGDTEAEKKDDDIPATIIHLDSHIVDFIDRDGMFIVCVKKSYVFIIPKSAFTEEEVQNTREKLSSIMGIRYKLED